MIKNRRHAHIGLGTKDVEATSKWYMDVLGFELIGDFKAPDGNPIKFLKNRDVVYEMYQDSSIAPEVAGKIDHYSFESQDIEADYDYCVRQGYQVTTNAIEGISTLWERGVRYFKIASPTGEDIEFCQIL